MLSSGEVVFELPVRSSEVIALDDHVILVSSDDVWCLGRAGQVHSARIGRKGRKVSLGALVGAPWGATFSLAGGRGLVRCKEERQMERSLPIVVNKGESDGKPVDLDLDAGSKGSQTQKLTQDEIEEMKRRGVSPDEILLQLAKGSSTFGNKTEFAKEKYLRRKEARYRYYVRVKRPCARTVCHVYYKKNPEKTMNMRYDALGILLNSANVRPHSQVRSFPPFPPPPQKNRHLL